MTEYIVLYNDPLTMLPLDVPQGFRCQADDPDHAEEQCQDAYPKASILWIHEGSFLDDALYDFWHSGIDPNYKEQ